MKDAQIDEMLAKAARVSHEVDAVLLERVADMLKSSLHPVRPLPPVWVLASGLVAICAAVALAGVAGGGFYGVERLGLFEGLLIFSTLCVLAWMVAKELVSALSPGSRHRLTPSALLLVASFALLGVFALLFRDYRTDHYISAGLICLRIGLLQALPIALLGWLLLRRGFAVDPVSAGLVGGTLAGLGGVAAVELRCTDFHALHVLLWHVAVVPVSGAVGAAVGWTITRIRDGERDGSAGAGA
jgi:hypothetical protein